MFSAIAATRAGRTRRATALVGGDQLGQRRDRQVGVVAQRGRAGLVHEHQQVGRRAVQQPERHAGVGGVEEAALALDEQQVAALGALVHEPLARAGHVVGDHVVDRDPPAGDRHAGLAGRHVDGAPPALARRPGRARASRPSCRSRCPSRRCAPPAPSPAGCTGPAGTVRSAGAARRSRSATPARVAARRSSGSSESWVCRPGLDVEAGRDRLAQRSRARPGRACRRSGATPISSAVAPRSIASASVATIGTGRRLKGTTSDGRAARLGRVDHRDDLARAVADHAVGGLAVVARRTGPRRRWRAARSRRLHPQPGRRRRQHAAVLELEPAERLVGAAAGARRGRPSRPARRSGRRARRRAATRPCSRSSRAARARARRAPSAPPRAARRTWRA